MKILILGNNSAIPAHGRNPSAQVVEIKDQLLLLDCGEGTQMQMIKYAVKRSKINHIFISHLHGDHYFGLIGLVNSFGLLGRTDELNIYCPEALPDILKLQLAASNTMLPYVLNFHTFSENGERRLLVETPTFSVTNFPVEHKITTHGFLICEKQRMRALNLEACRTYEVPQFFYKKLQAGEDYERKDGFVVKNEWLTTEGKPDKTYAYCADSKYTLSFLNDIKNVDLMYHESTYLNAELELANARFHSTAEQAATLAKEANAKQLLLGHYSSRYKDVAEFELQAKAVFPNTVASLEGMEIHI